MVKNFPIVSNADPLEEFRIVKLNTIALGRPSKSTKGKWHSFIYVSSGSGLLLIDFDEHVALKNKFFFIEKYKDWGWIKLERLDGIMVQFTDSFYNHIYTGNPKIKSDQSLAGEISPFIKIELNNIAEWENVMSIILWEYSALRENSKEVICLGLKILILMYRRNTYSRSRLIIADHKKQLLGEFRGLVNNRFAELKTPKGFAQKLNITPSYLNSLCKEIYTKTVSEIIQERVILEAKRLLAHTGLSVSEISFKLGFDDNSYFGRYFKKAVGISPARYRTGNYIS
jgi:AraC family transcriptional regulator, transcriptional activator of pobA